MSTRQLIKRCLSDCPPWCWGGGVRGTIDPSSPSGSRPENSREEPRNSWFLRHRPPRHPAQRPQPTQWNQNYGHNYFFKNFQIFYFTKGFFQYDNKLFQDASKLFSLCETSFRSVLNLRSPTSPRPMNSKLWSQPVGCEKIFYLYF